MVLDWLAAIPALIIAACGIVLLLNDHWRWNIAALAVQYAVAFYLIYLSWPLNLAAVKLISGWMAGVVLSASSPSLVEVESEESRAPRFWFRLFAAVLIIALVFSLLPGIENVLPVRRSVLLGSLMMVSMGLLQLGMTTQPFKVILGLLAGLTGFDVLYSALETSILIAGLQAALTLGLALVGAYLMAEQPAERKP